MKVKDAIKLLKEMDQNAELSHLWDGELRTDINFIYMGKTGICVTSDYNQVAYSDDARPKNAPCSDQYSYWRTDDCEDDGD